MVEVTITTLILALALTPMYLLFTRSSKSVFQSRVSYLALHVVREELEGLRQIPFERLPEMVHDWQPVTGHMLRGAYPPDELAELGTPAEDSSLAYPAEYSRIETRLSISTAAAPASDLPAPADPRLAKVLLLVRWQEKGESPEEGGAGFRKALSRYETLIGNHGIRGAPGTGAGGVTPPPPGPPPGT